MKKGITKALHEMGIQALNPMQIKTIEAAKQRKNILLKEPTGSGKTYAYLIPLLDSVNSETDDTEGLVITPTRELALQVAEEAQKLSVYTGHHIVTLIGGMDIHHQENALKHRPSILIGTPGRIADLLNQNKIDLHQVKMVILDEADQILTTGQKDTVLKILSLMPDTQYMLVSATWNEQLQIFLKGQYTEISNGEANQINHKVTAFYDVCEDKQKELMNILHHEKIFQAIVFVRYKSEAADLSAYLQKNHILSMPFSSYYDERTRRHTLESFKQGTIRILSATDAAARGLDITDISHIIHYDLPQDQASFIHRSGRTAHQNNEGMTIALITPQEEDEAAYIKEVSSPYVLPETEGSDLSIPLKKEAEKKPDAVTVWINAGRKDKLRPKDIIGALCTIISFDQLGALEIQDTCSTIIIQNTDPDLMTKLKNLSIKGKVRKYKLFN